MRHKTAMDLLMNAALKVPRVRQIVKEYEALRDQRDSLAASRDNLIQQRDGLAARLTASETRPPPSPNSPFFHYNTAFDPVAVMHAHAASGVLPSPGFYTNYLGVRIDPKFFPSILQGLSGQVESIPIPANWHADIAEWGAALRAVDLARGSFTMIELGCGWGCWMNNTGVAARRAGLNVHVIGVEGDEHHLGFAREATATNGFSPTEVTLHRGIAAPTSGMALFPRQEKAGMHWGLQPIFGATDKQRRQAAESGNFDELPMIALAEIAAPHPRIDLLHIDIQGGEADFIDGCLGIIRDKVAYILVGTHSRQIEGRIMDTLFRENWILEIERPAIFRLDTGSPLITVDGVQGWRNPKLTGA